MYRTCKVLGSVELALDERLVDDHFGGDTGESAPLPRLDLFRIGSKLCCMRSTPTETQSISEKDFECLASTGVNTPGTMFPDSVDRRPYRAGNRGFHGLVSGFGRWPLIVDSARMAGSDKCKKSSGDLC